MWLNRLKGSLLNSIFITSLHPRQFMKIVPDAPGAFLKRSFSRFARALHTGQYTFSVSNIAAPFCMWIVAWMGFEPTTVWLKVRCATELRHHTLLGGSPPPYPTIMEESMASRKRQEPRAGIEPTTFWLHIKCSASWAIRAYQYGVAFTTPYQERDNPPTSIPRHHHFNKKGMITH